MKKPILMFLGTGSAGMQHLSALRNLNSVHPLAVPLRTKRRAVRTTVKPMGGLDILVHTAAYVGTTQHAGWAVPFPKQTVQAFDQAIRVNLTSALTLVHEARSALACSGHGSVILLSSIYGVVGPDPSLYVGTTMANPVGYGASKGGLIQTARYLATMLAPRVRGQCPLIGWYRARAVQGLPGSLRQENSAPTHGD